MTLTEALCQELDDEAAITRKMLASVPDDKFNYQPHPRSMTLGRLAGHVAEIPYWAYRVLAAPSFDVAPGGARAFAAFSPTSQKELLDEFDVKLAQCREALAATNDAALAEPWSLLRNGAVAFTLPRYSVVRKMCFNHAIHHRAQLGVYFRLLSLPVPSIYGPSGDDPGSAAAKQAS